MLVTKLVMEHAVHEQDEKEIAALKEMNGALFAEVVKTKMEEDAIVRRASQASQCVRVETIIQARPYLRVIACHLWYVTNLSCVLRTAHIA